MLRISVLYPKPKGAPGAGPPYPLAVFTGGFLVPSQSYFTYAQHLASYGYTALLYDKLESAFEPLDDLISVSMIGELLDWARLDPVLSRIADSSRTFLCGHSRGGKLSVLAAVGDPRVKAVFLADPVDSTVWAPEGPDFPSAIAALQRLPSRTVPLAVVGGGVGSDCAPKSANYRRFYEFTGGPAWEVLVRNAGHFQFLDNQSALQRAICAVGPVDDSRVRAVAQAVMVAWGEALRQQSS
ncbi:hypothetical protein WJX81_001257 [Elliptochloris bilobata]|uniref:Chlorophyllase n=1 Tax=Elliptochloris bilobata TaxID=381761 RepID=A0AAW1SIZ9_9CHLO